MTAVSNGADVATREMPPNRQTAEETLFAPSIQQHSSHSAARKSAEISISTTDIQRSNDAFALQQAISLLSQHSQPEHQEYLPFRSLRDRLLPPLHHHQHALVQHDFASHNLIPLHLQTPSEGVLTTLNGTPGYPPAQIPHLLAFQQRQQQTTAPFLTAFQSFDIDPPRPIFTVQDRPMEQPVYNGVNPAYPGLRVLNTQPPIFCVDNFLSDFECDFLIQHAQDSFGPAPVVGKGAGEVSPSRTSATCYLAREDLPGVLRKVSCLTGKPVEHCELPQVGRYFPAQQYLQHYDAFDMSTEDGRRFAANGGQRSITVLIYLNTVERGGATRFPALNLDVQPVRGMALIFFPATVDGLMDKMALHAALPAIDTKYVSQVWIRQSTYSGQPSKRLPHTLGVPFGQELGHHQQQADLSNLRLHRPQQHQLILHPHQQTIQLNLDIVQPNEDHQMMQF